MAQNVFFVEIGPCGVDLRSTNAPLARGCGMRWVGVRVRVTARDYGTLFILSTCPPKKMYAHAPSDFVRILGSWQKHRGSPVPHDEHANRGDSWIILAIGTKITTEYSTVGTVP